MKTFIIKNLVSLIALTVAVIIFLFTCKPPKPTKPIITIVHDTVWVKHDSVVYADPQIITIIRPIHDTIPSTLVPDTNCRRLLAQFIGLRYEWLSKYVFQDRLKIDSTGYVDVTDTVTQNKITGRKYSYSLKYPIVTNTITIREPYKPVNQFYIGLEMDGEMNSAPDVFELSALIKNKKDNMIGLGLGMNTSGNLMYSLKYYKKISFR